MGTGGYSGYHRYKKRIAPLDIHKKNDEKLINDMKICNENVKAILSGIDLILKSLYEVLNEEGVKPIKAVGKPFNPQFHEAEGEVRTNKFQEGIIAEELQKGFTYDERAGNKYTNSLTFKLSDRQLIILNVQKIIDADNLLFELSPVLRFLAKNLLRIKPGYFRLKSEYLIDFLHNGDNFKEKGDTLHEMVIVK